MGGGIAIVFMMLIAVIAIPLAIIAIVYLIVPLFKGIIGLVRHIFRFIFGMISDTLRGIGAVITGVAFMPLVIGNVALGRWSAAAHFGRAIQAEGQATLRSIYRVLIGHPARFLCLNSLTDGIENRLPQAVAAAPGPDRPRGKASQFDGYTIVGSLPGGGSGSRLYVAEPDAQKLAAFRRAGVAEVDRVVIKCFSLREGSSLPQIVRESRALDAAKRLGLILEHELTADRFHYVMRYVPGDALGLVTQRLHAASGSEGLGDRELREVLEYQCDLLRTLCHYHDGGLWHKDVKPDNIIVARGQAHLVDFGLVTPLRSAMTLTTHGTEYFRDPEMVRMALKGVKVHEVDGARFDVYAAGAVLYSMIENSFPAHGGLSQISRRCPEALRWVVRRAMTDYDKRYPTAAAMLDDVEAILAAEQMFAVKPAALPSMRRSEDADDVAWDAGLPEPEPVAAGSPAGAYAGMPGHVAAAAAAAAAMGAGAVRAAEAAAARIRPRIRVTSWWSGCYDTDGADQVQAAGPRVHAAATPRPAAAPFARRSVGVPASEQLRSARARAAAARQRARERAHLRVHNTRGDRNFPSGVNGGVAAALFAFLVVTVGVAALILGLAWHRDASRQGATVAERASVIWQELAERAHAKAEVARESVERSSQSRRSDRRRSAQAPRPAAAPTNVATVPAVATATLPPDASAPQVLVLREPITLTPEAVADVNDRLARLRTAGFELIGNADRPAASEDEVARQDALIADLRNTVGVLPFLSPDAAERVRTWLATEDDIAMVLWIGRGKNGAPQHWLVGPPTLDLRIGTRAYEALEGR